MRRKPRIVHIVPDSAEQCEETAYVRLIIEIVIRNITVVFVLSAVNW